MNLLKTYIINFLNRSGGHIFLSTIVARLLSFFSSWIVLQTIPNKELGVVLFAYHIIVFLIPFSGFGLHHSLMRYGALLKTKEEKNALFVYVLKKGLVLSFLLVLLLFFIGNFIPFEYPKTQIYLGFLGLLLPALYLFQTVSIQFRLLHKNKIFAFVQVTYNFILVILVFVLSHYFQEIGYIMALIISPIIASILYLNKLTINFKIKTKPKVINFSFWKYGFFGGLTSVVSDLLFAIDIILIGYLSTNSEMVTAYRYASIIPLSLLFLSRVFITTDYVAITEKINNKSYVFNYIKSYMRLFLLTSILLFCFFYVSASEILSLFDKDFTAYTNSFRVLVFGVTGILILRGLFGNLLSSIGKIEINAYIMLIALALNIISNLYMIPKYGILGAAITSTFLMWFTGFFSWFWFLFLYKKSVKNG